MTDPIADMLTRIRNGLAARHQSIILPYSRVKHNIAKVLLDNGYLADVRLQEEKPFSKLVIDLKYVNDEAAITTIKRISKPGCRVYVNAKDIPTILGGHGLCVISTSSGVLSGKEAKAKNLGGEHLCSLW
ncbi:30S ribosomal protein S8 [Microgenomates group bacterium]|nr:30S ribosomal protein S8 [Microgenomates group bacterium]